MYAVTLMMMVTMMMIIMMLMMMIMIIMMTMMLLMMMMMVVVVAMTKTNDVNNLYDKLHQRKKMHQILLIVINYYLQHTDYTF